MAGSAACEWAARVSERAGAAFEAIADADDAEAAAAEEAKATDEGRSVPADRERA